MAEELEGVALVTGGGRGVGASVARELAACGMRVAVTARTAGEVEGVAGEIGGLALTGDASRRADVEGWVARAEEELGPLDLLVANAGVAEEEDGAWTLEPERWWRVLEVNVLGAYLTCRAAIPGMLERGAGRIVITGSGASYLPGSTSTAYAASKAAVGRFGEVLATQLAPHDIPVFVISPGLVRTAMTEESFPDDAPWTPPECAPRLVAALATGRFDRLSGRYIHAEHDPPDELEQRIDAILADDLNALRLRRKTT
jgi:NAD(P)-dependent dehydrogenase (short-subunit alcohol dehydrogenase family)